MKKKVLLSVFAASLFAAPVALADEARLVGEYTPDNSKPLTLDGAYEGLNKDMVKTSEEKTRLDNKFNPGEKLKFEKDGAEKANKPAAPAGQKTLPKTSAAK